MKMFDRNTICATCLSQDRKLYPIGTLLVFLKFYPTLSEKKQPLESCTNLLRSQERSKFKTLPHTDNVCWECKYTAQKMVSFLEKAQKAQAWLQNRVNGQLSDIPCFSTLCTTTLSDMELTSSDATVPEPLFVAVKQDDDDTSDNRSQCSYRGNDDSETVVKIERDLITEIPVIKINKVEPPDTTMHNTSSNVVHNIELPAHNIEMHNIYPPSNFMHSVATFLPNVMHYAELPNNVMHNIGLPAPGMQNIPFPNNIMHNVGSPNTMWHNTRFPNNIFNTGLSNNMMHNISRPTKAMRNVRKPKKMHNTEQHNNIMHNVQPPTNRMHNIAVPATDMHNNIIVLPASEIHNITVPITGMYDIRVPTNVVHKKEPPSTNMTGSVEVPGNKMLEFEVSATVEHNISLEKRKQEEITKTPTDPADLYTEEALTEQGLTEWWEKKRNLYNYLNCPPKFRCESCMDTFDAPAAAARHAKMHTETYGDFECDICKRRAVTIEGREKHRKLHYRLLKCRYCEFVWDDANGMRQHCSDQHKIKQTVWHCEPCELQFTSSAKFGNHERRHRRVRCIECDKRLPQTRLWGHIMAVHRGIPPKKPERQECSKCGKMVTNLRHHMTLHTFESDPAAFCVACDRQFRDVVALRYHLRNSVKHAADSDFQYKCGICKKSFEKSSNLERHQVIMHHASSNQQLYSCEKCDQTFSSKVAYRGHVRGHALATLPKDKFCDYCGKAFKTKIILSQHINTHTGARPFVCKICGADFGHQSALYLHGRYKHKIKGRDGKLLQRKKKVKNAKDTSSSS